MFISELDTFIRKFQQLLKAGHVAHLDVDTNSGRRMGGPPGPTGTLGQAPGHLHHQQPQTVFKDTPSRQRHRARRVAGQTAES